MVKYKEFKLKNSIRLVVVPLKGMNSVTLEVFLKIGSKYERESEYGMSHFLEHMAFKGTKKRPRAIDINKEIDSKGASYNAFTNQEMTAYYITTIRENISWATEILSDILFNSVYSPIEFEKEKGVIIEEIKMYKDNPMMGLSGDFAKFIYKGSSGCWNVTGEKMDIFKKQSDDLVNFRNKYINPEQIVMVVAGDVDGSCVKFVEENFGWFKNGNKRDLPNVKIKYNKVKRLSIKKDGVEQGHFCIGVPGLPWTDKRKYTLSLLDVILSGNSSSRLYQEIREERGLAYYVYSVGESFKETGFVAVQSGVKLDKLDETLVLVEKEFLRLADSLEESELNRSKEYILGKMKLKMDKSDFWSNFVGEKLLLENKLETLEFVLEQYKKVNLKNLVTVAKELFLKNEIRILKVSQ